MARCKKTVAKAWTATDVKKLKKIFRNQRTADVARELGRGVASVQAKASVLGLTKTNKYLKSIGRA